MVSNHPEETSRTIQLQAGFRNGGIRPSGNLRGISERGLPLTSGEIPSAPPSTGSENKSFNSACDASGCRTTTRFFVPLCENLCQNLVRLVNRVVYIAFATQFCFVELENLHVSFGARIRSKVSLTKNSWIGVAKMTDKLLKMPSMSVLIVFCLAKPRASRPIAAICRGSLTGPRMRCCLHDKLEIGNAC